VPVMPCGARLRSRPLWPSSLLVEPSLRMRAARRAAVLRDAHPRGNIAELVAREPDAHQGRRLADGADAVLLVDQNFPDLLRVPDPPSLIEAGGGAEQVEDLDQVRIVGFAALIAA